MERARTGGENGKEQGMRQMCVDLMLLTCGTPIDILADKRHEAQLPELRGNELASFENTRMSSRGVVMVVGDDRVAEIGISEDIDAILWIQGRGGTELISEGRINERVCWEGE